MPILVEGCVGSIEESLAAEVGGARRLELCANLDVGGTTPSRELALEVKRRVKIPVAMMARPRGGSFVFTAAEVDETRRDLDLISEYGADVAVIGLLTPDGGIDVPHTRELARRAGSMPVTVHLAFDQVQDQLLALDTLIDLGVARVLTSGAGGTALRGADQLQRLVDHADGRIAIMAGGKVRGDNVAEVVRRSGVREVHARCELDPSRIRDIVDALTPLTAS